MEMDKMGRGLHRWTETRSLNQIHLSSPYRGGTSLELTLRHSPDLGKDAFITVNRGQLMCHSGDCSVTLRFDEAKPIKWRGMPPSSASSRAIFLANYPRLLSLLRTAKRLQVEVEFYNEGRHIFEFDVGGLVWDK